MLDSKEFTTKKTIFAGLWKLINVHNYKKLGKIKLNSFKEPIIQWKFSIKPFHGNTCLWYYQYAHNPTFNMAPEIWRQLANLVVIIYFWLIKWMMILWTFLVIRSFEVFDLLNIFSFSSIPKTPPPFTACIPKTPRLAFPSPTPGFPEGPTPPNPS